MKGSTLTERQSEMLDTIRSHIKRRGIPPSRFELAKGLKISNQAGVDRMLSALVKKGWLRLIPGIDRGMQLLREGAPLYDLEDLQEAAGDTSSIPGYDPEPKRLHDFDTFVEQFGSKPDYFVKVGRNRTDLVGYKPGDILAVRRGGEPHSGDVVVVRIGDEVTLRRFCPKGENSVELLPVHSDSKERPIQLDTEGDFEVSGVVVGAIIGTRRE